MLEAKSRSAPEDLEMRMRYVRTFEVLYTSRRIDLSWTWLSDLKKPNRKRPVQQGLGTRHHHRHTTHTPRT